MSELSVAQAAEIIKAHIAFANGIAGGKKGLLRYVQLPKINLSGRNLKEIDFSGADLTRSNFAEANLELASFYCADIQDSNFSRACLRKADMRGVRIRGANLSNAVLDGADFRAATIGKLNTSGSFSITGRGNAGEEFLSGVDFSDCSMHGVSLNSANLAGANFKGAILQNARFKNAVLTGADFEGADLTGVEISDLKIPKDALKNCVFSPGVEQFTRLADIRLQIAATEIYIESAGKTGHIGNVDGEDLRLIKNELRGRKLTRMSAKRVVAIGVDFSNCELQACNFEGADLRGADFSNADIRGANFEGANLCHSRFENSNTLPLELKTGVKLVIGLSGANLVGTPFQDCDVAYI